MLKSNVVLGKKKRISSWRKTAIGTWSMTGDCQVYCLQTVGVEMALKKCEEENVKLIHLVGKICGEMIKAHPEINTLLRFGNLYPRKEISVFFQVASDKTGEDLSGHVVRHIDKKTLQEVKEDMTKVVSKIKKGDDVHYKKVKKQMQMFPGFILPFVMKIYGAFLYTFNLWSQLLGAPRDAFGSMMITNIGSLDMQTAFAPLVPYSRCPLILSLGKVYERPVVKNGQIVVEKSVDCCWTLDHRVIDGVVGAQMSKTFEKLITSFD